MTKVNTVPTSTRFAVAIHILADLALHKGKAVRSEDIACSVNTNAAVVRRLLGVLAEAGMTRSQLGVGGGALLAKPADEITLLDVYQAVEEPNYFVLHRSKPNPKCYIGCNITSVLEEEFQRISATMDASLAQTTIADVARQVADNAGVHYQCAKQEISEDVD
ncbi:Rrf2 family transcriptional regulator [Hahella aquimaris]|uniref:Rrf2 family transcriptional regulator n=1 Tax=Hahella sp. HNIBRBA332 TaxID=3015983 RepID=UPI00273CBD45|nr:Rrf2 family transcriptional regulator [Hahella sp. HNIBRBA332]WLQ16200.1 Rrf2 family transcriptional regulator [Hahella sp. HNIBRBA332]